jgi:polysaccharide export outer membrane protein
LITWIKRVIFLLFVLFSNFVFAQDYTLNPGDQLEISVWDEENLQRRVIVLPDGTISFPLAGHINVLGKTPVSVEKIIENKLKAYISNPVVTLSVTSPKGYNVFIIGQVRDPGSYIMSSPIGVVQALSLAGGFTRFADKDDIIVIKADSQEQITFDYTKLNKNGNIQLNAGDTIVVP